MKKLLPHLEEVSSCERICKSKHEPYSGNAVGHNHPVPARPHNLSQPSILPGFQSQTEYDYSEFFREKTALELSGYFDTNIWDRLILQVCHEEPFARQAVIAIGALTMTSYITAACTKPELLTLTARKHYDYALRQYGKALRLMQNIHHQERLTRLRNTLVSSLLTTCFETYIGNQDNAVAQARAGVEVLAESQNRPPLGGNHPFLDNDLVCTFARLNSQILMFKDTQAPTPKSDNQSNITPCPLPLIEVLPPIFESVKEARVYWDFIVEAAMLRATAHPNRFSTLDFGENNVRKSLWKEDEFSQKIQDELRLYTATTEQWFQAFQPVFDRSRAQKDITEFHGANVLMTKWLFSQYSVIPEPTTPAKDSAQSSQDRIPLQPVPDRSRAEKDRKEFLGASILMIKYLSSRIAVPRPGEECDAYEDEFLPDYITIVDLARGLLEADEPNRIGGRPIFIFDDSLVAGLFLVATRCRERRVRRQAIHLLQRYPRREGLWDSSMAAKVATYFMETEEQGLEGDFIPPSARMKIVKNDFVLSERKAVVRCSKVGDFESIAGLPEVTLTW